MRKLFPEITPARKRSPDLRAGLPLAFFLLAGMAVFLLLARAAEAAPLTLPQVTTRALEVSPLVGAAKERVARARARLGQARASRGFQASLTTTARGASADVYLPPPPHETYDEVENVVTIPIPVGSRLKELEDQGRSEYEAAKAELRATRLQVATLAQNGYFDLLKNKALRDIAKENLEQAESELSAARERFEAGDAPELDVLRAETPVAMAKADLLTAEGNLTVAQQTLASLLQLPLSTPLDVTEIANSPLLTLSLTAAEQEAVENSPLVSAASSRLRASQAALLVAGQGHVPQLAFQASDLRSGDITTFSRLDTVSLSLTFPILDSGLVREQVDEQKAAVQEARDALFQAKQDAELAAATAFVTAQKALARVPLAQAAETVARRTLDKTREGYAAGLLPIIDVLNAQRAYIQARIARAQAIYEAASAVQALNRAIGKEMP